MKKIVRSSVLVIAGLVAGVMVIPALANTPIFNDTDQRQMISEEEAIEIALNNSVETFEVVSVELDDFDDDDDQEYELLLRNDLLKVEVEIDAYSGEIDEWDVEMISKDVQDNQTMITLEQAKEIALNKAGSGYQVIKAELEDDNDDDDDQEYELELLSDQFKIEVEIDAYTGQITEWEAEAVTSNSAAVITRERAIEIALTRAGSGFSVSEVEFDDDDDDDDDTPEYEIELRSSTQEIEVEINAITGEITKWEVETFRTESNSNSTLITRERAIAIAREKIGSSPVLEEFELDEDDDRMIYELEFNDGEIEYDFEIDAVSGEIVEFEIDD